MSDEQKQREAEVFGQEVSVGDLDAISGGTPDADYDYGGKDEPESDMSNCVQKHKRPIYGGGGFPNCAATVEDGSFCNRNDACYDDAIHYIGITSVHGCHKAHA